MILHIFNPEHDIALASGLANFTAPHAGRQLRHDLGFLPAIWAKEGDVILVDDVEQATRSWQRISHRLRVLLGIERTTCQFSNKAHNEVTGVNPWGWNSALKARLVWQGVRDSEMPTSPQLQTIRDLSHRRTAAALLPKLRMEGTIGGAIGTIRPVSDESTVVVQRPRPAFPFCRANAFRATGRMVSEHCGLTRMRHGRAILQQGKGLWHGIRIRRQGAY